MATGLPHATVYGGPHANASFMPTNGVAAKQRVELKIADLRARGVKNPRGRFLDDQQKKKHGKKPRK